MLNQHNSENYASFFINPFVERRITMSQPKFSKFIVSSALLPVPLNAESAIHRIDRLP